MKLLVTGSAGFIGSHLCEALLKKGHSVIGLDNFNDFYSPALKYKNLEEIESTAKKHDAAFQCVTGDICDQALVTALFTKHSFDGIIHLAAMAGVRPSIQNPILYERVNGLGTLVLLEAAKKAGVFNFIFGSSSSVYGLNKKVPFTETDPVDLPFSPYASTKRSNELALRVYHELYGLNVAALRFFTVYGPRQRPDLAIRKFADLIFNDKPIPVFGDGSHKRDFTYVDDVIDGVLKSLDWAFQKSKTPKYEIFNLGECATTSVIRLIELIENTSGKKAKREFRQAEPGDVPITHADISKAKKILGYRPQTSIDEGIPRFMDWHKKTAGMSTS